MVSSPIGGFMPIPLAIMPPFMAYQSLLMGDSFGKGFQYGKRKISAMTNEEFNKMSLPDLFRDSMNEYESMIPTVEKSMDNSTKLQNSIIDRMLKIIPELLGSFFSGSTDKTDSDSPFLKNQTDVSQNAAIQAMQATIQNIRYTTDRDPVFNTPAIEEFQKLLDKVLEQTGTKESLEEKLNPPPPPPPPPPDLTLYKNLSAQQQFDAAKPSENVEWQTWSKQFASVMQEFNEANNLLKKWRGTRDENTPVWRLQVQKKKLNAEKIRRMSNDYRNPNNLIRKNVLSLRKRIAAGLIK